MKTQAEVKHMQTPLKVRQATNAQGFKFVSILDAENNYVCEFNRRTNNDDVENAERFVRDVNSHDALLEAAKMALKYLNDNCGGMNPKQALESSIAQASGKGE